MAAYNALSSDQIPDGAHALRTTCAAPFDQIPDGAPLCAAPSDQTSDGAPWASHIMSPPSSAWPGLRDAQCAPALPSRPGGRRREGALCRHPLYDPALRTYVAGAGGLPWDSWLELKGETLRLIYPDCEREPSSDRLEAFFAQIATTRSDKFEYIRPRYDPGPIRPSNRQVATLVSH